MNFQQNKWEQRRTDNGNGNCSCISHFSDFYVIVWDNIIITLPLISHYTIYKGYRMPVIIRPYFELMCTYMLYLIGAKVLISTSIFERARKFF